jgi:hypothetical protein
MRLFSTRAHAMIDYTFAGVLIVMPWFAIGVGGAARLVLVGAGVAIIAYSLLTDYELGMFRTIQVPIHLFLDGAVALMLATSPWLFEFDHHVWQPHLAAGVVFALVALFTDTIPGYDRRRADAAAV